MGKGRRRILFVSHNATHTGAPHILLGIIREFEENGNWDIQVLVMEDGPLVKEFKLIGKTFVWYHKPRYLISSKKGLISFIIRTYYKIRGIFLLWKIKQVDIVFLNTITNGLIHRKLVGKSKHFITYVHELESSIRANTNAESLNQALEHTSYFFAGSGAVARMLRDCYKVDEGKMMVLYSSLQSLELNRKSGYRIESNAITEGRRIPADAFVIGILGTGEWRKGFDWLFPVMKMYFKKFPNGNAYFIWKGVSSTGRDSYHNSYDFVKSKLCERVILLPHGNDAMSIMENFDVHLLLAREDPFPLVALEAASFGIPTICFKDAGGIPEFVGEDAGICIEYGDIDAVAEAIIYLERNPELVGQFGSRAKEKVADYQSSKAAQTIMAVAEQFMK